ncbi:MAG: NUDIX domain-containing protein [Gemmatimonadota bacterium]
MTLVRASIVDVYPLRGSGADFEVLGLRRAPDTRCGGSWEVVHGHVEGEESPVAAALRELREETGVDAERLYNVSRVESFFLHRSNEIALIPAFAAFLDPGAAVRLSAEHDAHEWMKLDAAKNRLAWPREHRALEDIVTLFRGGNAGLLEDVLRVSGPNRSSGPARVQAL